MPHKSVQISGHKLAKLIADDPLLTNAKIARALGVVRETVGRWKTGGRVGMNVDAFDRLAAYLRREPTALLEEIGAGGIETCTIEVSRQTHDELLSLSQAAGVTTVAEYLRQYAHGETTATARERSKSKTRAKKPV